MSEKVGPRPVTRQTDEDRTTICPVCKEWTVIDEDGYTCCAEVDDPEWFLMRADDLRDRLKEDGQI